MAIFDRLYSGPNLFALKTWRPGVFVLSLLVLATTGPVLAQSPYLRTSTTFVSQAAANADALVVLVPAGVLVSLPAWADSTRDQVGRAMVATQFTGEAASQQEILAPVGLAVDRLILLGVGNPAELPRHQAETMGAALSVRINATRAQSVMLDSTLIADTAQAARIAAEVAHGVFTARELTNLTGGDGYPAAFAEYARQRLAPLGVEVTILSPEQVLEQGMGSLYGVSQGSQHKAHLLVAHWQGSDDQPIALVGKGNTFDTGGYNLKTDANSILQMQGDKAGGAAVVGAVMALAGQRAPVNVVGVVPLSQNAISGEALLPGDVVTAGNGKTIEVASTDAEGRLILADGIWYAREHFNPRAIADIATLTGAKTTALGTAYSAIFTNQPEIRDSMTYAGELTGELVWPLPLNNYPGIIDSRIADMRNTGTPGAQAGAIFLQQFAQDTPWIHIDMASEALGSSASGINPEGATGHGVRLLAEWVKLFAN
jgi:leucyl aminopeptidase